MDENALSRLIIGAAIQVHRQLDLLLNFNELRLRDGIRRLALNL